MKKKNNLNIVINVSIIVTYLIFFALVLILFTGIGTVDKAIIRGGVLFLVGILFIVLASIFRKKAQFYQNNVMDRGLKIFCCLAIICAVFGLLTFVTNLIEVLL